MPPAGPGELANPSVLVALGQGLNCPAGTEFYVMGIDPTTKNRTRRLGVVLREPRAVGPIRAAGRGYP